jgi:hypothetical protein
MKNVFSRQKSSERAPGTSSGRLGTASRAAQQQGSVIGAPPGSAARRLQTGSATAKRPTTAVQGAGFMTGTLGSGSTTSAPVQFEKKEETYVKIMNKLENDLFILSNEDKAKKLEKIIIELVDESCLAYEKNDTKLV